MSRRQFEVSPARSHTALTPISIVNGVSTGGRHRPLDSSTALWKGHHMNEQENSALVQQGYKFFSQGDIPGVLKLMSPDVAWVLNKVENVPFTGTFKGVEGVAQFFTALSGAMDLLKYEPREFIAQGNKVVVLGESRYRVKGQKDEFDERWVDVLTVENGKITRYEQYGNTAQLERAFKSAR
jgi:ketosteroid isomerase-like protein